MPTLNKTMLIGNVTKDIELRYTASGTSVTDISLACNRTRITESGEKIEEVTYIDITLWGRLAEIAQQYSGKGKPLFIEGRLHMDTWKDKDTGANRQRLKVIAENIQLLSSAKPPTDKPAHPGYVVTQDNQKPDPLQEEDIPF